MAIDYAFPIVSDQDQQEETPSNVFILDPNWEEPSTESNHPVLKQLKDRIAELENELAMREETLLGVQEIVDKFWDTLPAEYCQAMNDRFA